MAFLEYNIIVLKLSKYIPNFEEVWGAYCFG